MGYSNAHVGITVSQCAHNGVIIMARPTQTIRNAAKRALEARDKAPASRKSMTLTGLARANQLARGDNLSIQTLKRMVSFLSRHEGNYKRAKAKGLSAEESPAIQSYLGWGGPSALAWAKRELQKAGR